MVHGVDRGLLQLADQVSQQNKLFINTLLLLLQFSSIIITVVINIFVTNCVVLLSFE